MAPGLREVLAAVLAEVPPRARQVLRAAAAAGRRVDDSILAVVLQAPDTEIADALRLAMARGILVEAEDGGGYAFRHALLREVAYAELLYGERDRLHGAFAASSNGAARLVACRSRLPSSRTTGTPPTSGIGRSPRSWMQASRLSRSRHSRMPAARSSGPSTCGRQTARRTAVRRQVRGPAPSSRLCRAVGRLLGCGRTRSAQHRPGRRTVESDSGRVAPGADALVPVGSRPGDDAAAAVDEALRLLPEIASDALPAPGPWRTSPGCASRRAIRQEPSDPRPRRWRLRAPSADARRRPSRSGSLVGSRRSAGGSTRALPPIRQGLAIAEELGGVEGIALGRRTWRRCSTVLVAPRRVSRLRRRGRSAFDSWASSVPTAASSTGSPSRRCSISGVGRRRLNAPTRASSSTPSARRWRCSTSSAPACTRTAGASMRPPATLRRLGHSWPQRAVDGPISWRSWPRRRNSRGPGRTADVA